MAANTRENKPEITLQDIATELLDTSAVALTVNERSLANDLVLLHVHGVVSQEERVQVDKICGKVSEVLVNDDRFDFQFVSDPDPPANFGKVGLYIPQDLAGEGEWSFKATSIEDGLANIKSR